jgi:hypothetical protein
VKVFRSFREDVPRPSQVEAKQPRSQKRCRFCVDRAAEPKPRAPMLEKTARGAAQHRRRTRRTFAAHGRSPSRPARTPAHPTRPGIAAAGRHGPTLSEKTRSPLAQNHRGGADIKPPIQIARDIFNVSSRAMERRGEAPDSSRNIGRVPPLLKDCEQDVLLGTSTGGRVPRSPPNPLFTFARRNRGEPPLGLTGSAPTP